MRYCKEYLISVHTDESVKSEELGMDAPEHTEWRKCYVDFDCVISFYEYVDTPTQTVAEYSSGKCLRLNVAYEAFKHDFQEYVKQASKPFFFTS
jgi:hypothetical protein